MATSNPKNTQTFRSVTAQSTWKESQAGVGALGAPEAIDAGLDGGAASAEEAAM